MRVGYFGSRKPRMLALRSKYTTTGCSAACDDGSSSSFARQRASARSPASPSAVRLHVAVAAAPLESPPALRSPSPGASPMQALPRDSERVAATTARIVLDGPLI